jgi:septum formation protein
MKRVKVTDKAGAYAIQEHGEMLADKVEGPFDNVVGLPMAKVAGELARFAILPCPT